MSRQEYINDSGLEALRKGAFVDNPDVDYQISGSSADLTASLVWYEDLY